MKKRGAFTLVELLVVIAIIAVLLAILLPSLKNAKSLAQRVLCRTKLKDIGVSVTVYCEQHDGRMPRSDYESGTLELKHAYWVLASRNDLTQPTQYYGFGGLWKAGQVTDGRQFYCSAVRNWLEEYQNYCNPMPWGTLPQVYNTTTYPSGNEFLRAYKGFLFWPQSRQPVTQAQYDSWSGASWKGSLYSVGYPGTPVRYADMSPSRSMALDCSPHSVQGSGFNVNALFGDGHVSLNLWPMNQASTPKKYYNPYLMTNTDWGIVQDLDAPYNNLYYWQQIPNAEYMAKFQP